MKKCRIRCQWFIQDTFKNIVHPFYLLGKRYRKDYSLVLKDLGLVVLYVSVAPVMVLLLSFNLGFFGYMFSMLTFLWVWQAVVRSYLKVFF